MDPLHARDAYANIAELYDLEHADYDEDIGLYLNLASVVGDPILELGCGTGRVLAPLAGAGHRVTGLDVSPAMLRRATRRLQLAGQAERAELVEAGFHEAERAPGGPFGLAIIALNGFMHETSTAAQRALLGAVHSVLDRRGMLVLDVMNPTPNALRGLEQGVVHEGSWDLGDGTRVAKFASRQLFSSDQRIDTELWYDRVTAEGSVQRTVTGYQMRWVHRAEMELMLELAGYAEWKVYGSYDLDPFDDAADRLIVTAEVSPS